MLEREVEVGHAGFDDGLDETARKPRWIEVQESHSFDLATERLGQFDEWLRAALVEYLDRFTASGATTVMTPTREVLGDEHEFLHAALDEGARFCEDLLIRT